MFYYTCTDEGSAPSCDHFGRHGEWKKYLATKILTKVANWRPTDYKRNLLGELVDILVELSKVKVNISFSFLVTLKWAYTGKKSNYTSCTLLRSGPYFHPDRDSSLLRLLQWAQTICHPSRPVGREINACLNSLGKIEQDFQCVYNKNNFIILFYFYISFGARSYGKIVRLFNKILSTGEKNDKLITKNKKWYRSE